MKIIEIKENYVVANYTDEEKNILQDAINHYVLMRDKRIFVGEIMEITEKTVVIRLQGEFINNSFIFGINHKPSINALIEIMKPELVPMVVSYPSGITGLYLGKNPIYENTPVYMNVDTFFNSHFTILGGTGSGKSNALSKIIQTLFSPSDYIAYNANLLIFDTYGEYYASFLDLEKNNPYISFKNFTTDPSNSEELLKIPPYLLEIDDLAILLNADTPNQLHVLEKALNLVHIFKSQEGDITKIKNNIISRAVLDILLSGRPSVQIRDQVFSVLSFYHTDELNLETPLSQPGYTRSLKNCLIIDTDGKIREIELLTKFFTSFLLDEDIKETYYLDNNIPYTLEDLENAIDFALISEGVLKSEKIYDTNNLLKVRIHNLIEGDYKKYFEYPDFTTKEDFIKSLITKNERNVQIVNFNINYVDDRFGKTIVKILSKMLFDITKNLKNRGSKPFHIILEEAHRYVQNDTDSTLLGYNIFERIAKEGRKYGVLLGLITQRPSELSETVMSQCNNFLLFKTTHPKDMQYIKNLIPYMDEETSKKIQILQPGNCYTFGPAFKMPMIVELDRPTPPPTSSNVNIISTWFVRKQ